MGQMDKVSASAQPTAAQAGSSTQFSPVRFLMITVGGIFFAELVAMFALLPFHTWPYWLQSLLDATIMVLLIFPIIYYFSLRPLLLQIEKRQQAERNLQQAHDEMELRVRERTEELRLANSELEAEINERRETEVALRQSEQRLNRSQEIAHLGSWELDLVKNQLTWSDEVYRIFGRQPQEFGATYEAFLEAVHPDDRAAVDEAYSGSIREGRDTYEIEHRVVRPLCGEPRIVHEKCEHFRDENGQIVRSVGMVHDVTERRRAEAALRQSEENFSKAFRSSPTALLITHLDDGHFIEMNDAYNEMVGYERNELLGCRTTDFNIYIKPTDQRNIIERLQSTGSIRDFETSIRHRSGEIRHVVAAQELITFDGEACILSNLMDITKRKRAEEALRMARDQLEVRVQERTEELAVANKELVKEVAQRQRVEQQLRIQTTAMEAAANGIVITDPQGKIEWANPALTQISGYESHEMIGQGMWLFRSGKHDERFYQQLWRTICNGNVWHGEITNRRKDGTLYVEEQTITPVRNGNSQISHFIAIKQDVTERNLIYAQLKESNRELTSLSLLERQQRKAAEILSQASVALSQTLDIQRVMETILDYIQMVLPTDAVFLILNEGDEQYRVRGVRSSEEQDQIKKLLDRSIDLLNEPVIRPFFEKDTSTLIRDSWQLEIWHPPLELKAMRSWLGIPLISTGRNMGMVAAANLQAAAFDQDQVELAEAVVAQATVALQNAWLFEQVRAGRQRLQLLSRHLVEIQENERKYIARELHDETSQALTSLKLGLHAVEQTADQKSTIVQKVAELKILADEILESLHRLAMNLRPASLDHLGLVEAITSLVQSIGERSPLTARFKSLGIDQRNRLTEDIESSVYRIVQESLTNVVRHANATFADVILEWKDDKIMIIVEDDGVGMDMASARATGHLGLVGMQERTEMLGGRLLIDSHPEMGTTLVVEIPYAY